MKKIKYPRTYHLSYSEAVQSDDKVQNDLSFLEGQEVVITWKMDGENTTIGKNYSHARSLDSGYHPSRNYVKVLQNDIGYLLGDNERICGENCYAKHSIQYNNLVDYFLGFSLWDGMTCLSWDDTMSRFDRLGITPVDVIYRGVFSHDAIKKIISHEDFYSGKQEGIVVRLAGSFHYDDFSKCVVKWVRANHVQTDKHWSKGPVVRNKTIQMK